MRRFSLILGFGLIVSILCAPALAYADVNDFVINKFASDQTLSRDDPQGELRIIEKIDLTYNDYNHGILRAIPQTYKRHQLKLRIISVSSETGAPSKYTTYTSNGNTVLKIGDPDRTITGQQSYTIIYQLSNVISFYDDHDELYWDINGDQWGQTINKVEMTLRLPAGLRQTEPPTCYAGRYGTKSAICTIESSGQIINAKTTSALNPRETLTTVAVFEKGYFTPSTAYQTSMEYARPLSLFFAPLMIIGGGSFLYWLLRGRDPRGRGVIVPEYEPPDQLKPIEVGLIADFGMNNKDITATIIDLAVRNYIRIIESKKIKKLRPDTTTYQLELVNPDVAGLNSIERLIINGLFTNPSKGQIVDLSALKNKLYKTTKDVSDQLNQQLTDQGYFRSNPLKAGKGMQFIYVGVFMLIVFLGWNTLGAPASVGLVFGAALTFIFSRFIPARTAKGVAAAEKVKGLKMYLEVAEKDRIEKLQGPSAKYAAGAAPAKTVELFEKLLPYAMVLGVEKQWAGQFEHLYQTPPDWYSGNWTTFNSIYLTDSLSKGIGTSVNTAFSAPSSSGSSGSGGGGFSGGGGGGGGGGGW